MTTPAQRRRVAELLGREPEGDFEVVVDEAGDPVVIRNEPLLGDGRPMPTRYWLVGEAPRRAVGRLESVGGVRQAEAAVDADELSGAHARYAAERDAAIEASYSGPRPSGGVGGTRRGVKCLHAHYAWYLAGGDDPVGRWVAEQLAAGLDTESFRPGTAGSRRIGTAGSSRGSAGSCRIGTAGSSRGSAGSTVLP